MDLLFSLGIPTLSLALFAAAVKKYCKITSLHPFVWISALYVFGAASNVFVARSDFKQFSDIAYSDISIMFVYVAVIAIYLLPISSFKPIKIVKRNNLLDIFSKLSIPFILFSFFYLVPFAVIGITTGAVNVRFDLAVHGKSILPETPLTTLAVTVAQFHVLYAFLFVYSYVFNARKYIKAMMFLGSLLYLISSFSFAARDGFIWLVMSYVYPLWFFKPALSASALALIKKSVVPVATVGLIIFSYFTIQRFSDRETSIFGMIISYFGQQPLVFVETIKSQSEFYYGDLRFPLVKMMIGDFSPVVRLSQYEWSFGTFVKDLYSVNGWGFLIASTICIPLATYVASRVTLRFTNSNPILAILYVQMAYQGIFYFRLGTLIGNAYILVMVLFWMLTFISPVRK